MRLNWFASPESSLNQVFLPQLTSGAEVRIWSQPFSEAAPPPWAEIHKGDLNLYVIDSQLPTHAQEWIVQISKVCPGLKIISATEGHCNNIPIDLSPTDIVQYCELLARYRGISFYQHLIHQCEDLLLSVTPKNWGLLDWEN